MKISRIGASLLTAVGVCLAAESSFKEIESRISDFTLSNGMKFIVVERHEAPVATYLTLADVGSVQETKGITGLAHIFEHMAFKGTSRIGTKDYAKEKAALQQVDQAFNALRLERAKGAKADPERIKQLEAQFRDAQATADKYVVKNEFGEVIERAGGRGLNASTAWDHTNYFFSLPSNASELWFYLESERFRDPVLREFYKERDVVMEERRMRTESQPIGKLIEEFVSVAYKAHPYGEPVVGHMSDLRNITREDGEAFFKKYYGASNLISVLVGDVDPKKMRALAESYFGRLPKVETPEPIRTVEPPQEGERRVSVEVAAQPLVLIGYHKPDINHPDNAVYDAISSLLSEGRSSRLYRSLVRDKKVAVAAGGFPGLPGRKYPGLFLFYAFNAPGKTNADVEKALDDEIRRLRDEPVSADELEGVKNRARAGLMRQLDNNQVLAMQLSEYQQLTGDWRNLFRDLERIEKVTPDDIQRVAKAAFVKTNRTVGAIEPRQTAAAK
jgi:predicted Zn-dependent peptidase